MKYIALLFAALCVISAVVSAARKVEDQVQPAESARLERDAHHHGHHHDHHEVVDFGAHTGDHGSFGWHADFPVHTDH